MDSAIKTEHLVVGYDKTIIVPDFDIEFPVGAITSIIGANGCGKSTTDFRNRCGKSKKRQIDYYLRCSSGNGCGRFKVDWFGRNFNPCKGKRRRAFNKASKDHSGASEKL